ncbi:MAG: AAA family ATPase [Trueperaceae bacterium]
MSAIERLSLKQFTAFEEADFDFSPGINVFIGTNGTGKTHILKILYSILKTFERPQEKTESEFLLADKLKGVFRPDTLGRLRRRSVGQGRAQISLEYDKKQIDLVITSQDRLELKGKLRLHPEPSLYIPPHEWLAVSEGFAALYQNRELAFDETYFDLSLALDAPLVRGPKLDEIQALLRPMQKALGAKVEKKNGRFYLRTSEATLEAHLASEGFRKLAGLVYLINNGSLSKNSILFWDEPEANLNPKMIMRVVELLKTLMGAGVQIFLATHDYLLSQELSLLSEYDAKEKIKFFSFDKSKQTSGVVVEQGRILAEISNNPILTEFAAHYDRELKLMDAEVSK